MAAGVTRRGHANTQPAPVAAAVQTAIDAAVLDLRKRTVRGLHPHAVVDDVGIVRALLRTPWRWEARTLTHVLMLGTLRG